MNKLITSFIALSLVFSLGIGNASVFASPNSHANPNATKSRQEIKENYSFSDSNKNIDAKALNDYSCDSQEWHFVINQIDAESFAPNSINVNFASGDNITIPLDKYTGKVAHYTDYSHLADSVVSASTSIYSSWSGQFNLSHGPCNEPSTPTEPVCQYNAQLPANDPDCFEPCEFDSTLPSDDPNCYEPCEWDESLPSDDPNCYEPCELDPTIPADHENCGEVEGEVDEGKGEGEVLSETITPPVEQLPETGASSILIGAISLGTLAASTRSWLESRKQ